MQYRPRKLLGITKAEVVALIAAFSLLSAMVIPALLPRDREKANLVACRGNLRILGAALLTYAQSNAGKLPVSPTAENPHTELTKALYPRYVSEVKPFYCPSETHAELVSGEKQLQSGTIGYFYYSASQASTNESLSKFLLTGVEWPRELDTTKDQKSWLMSDIWLSGQPTSHPGFRKGVNYLMLEGSVDFVSESPRQAFH